MTFNGTNYFQSRINKSFVVRTLIQNKKNRARFTLISQTALLLLAFPKMLIFLSQRYPPLEKLRRKISDCCYTLAFFQIEHAI